MLSDYEIALNANKLNIQEIAKKVNLDSNNLINYGDYKAKIDLNTLDKNDLSDNLILVTSINPTSSGEGKSTVTIGLNDAFNRLGHKSSVALREPSLGPVLGKKGGATGGGHSQVVPMEDINLYFTGDFYAITTAHNAISSFIHNHIFQGNELGIKEVLFNKVMDMNARELRNIKLYADGKNETLDKFEITAASEIMAILCLANDLTELKEMIANILIGYDHKDKAIFVRDLGIEGMILALLKDAFNPNLVQSIENNPVFIHGGPFANIAHGCNSIIATKTALKLSDIVITEAGFGADLGAQKFLDIKCRKSGLFPKIAVIVITVKALKLHGGIDERFLETENLESLKLGLKNLEKHIENLGKYNLDTVIAINKFTSDTDAEIKLIEEWAESKNVETSLATVWADGGNGALDLAKKLLKHLEKDINGNLLYEDRLSIKEKTDKICKEIYGAKNVNYSIEAIEKLEKISKDGFDELPVIIAKTPFSLSGDPKLIGRPEGFDINISDFSVKSGAGFVVAYTSKVITMPGLPKRPQSMDMDVDSKGNIINIS